MRVCRKCQENFPLSEFYEYSVAGKQYRRHVCKTCFLSQRSEWASKNEGRLREYNQTYYEINRQTEIAAAKAWNEANKEKKDANVQRHWAKLRDAAYAAYGGYRCQCCGETEPLFLSLDHVNNDGHKYRWKVGSKTYGPHAGVQLYRWLRDNDYPPTIQVLCMNCNMGKARNKGVCPHMTQKV